MKEIVSESTAPSLLHSTLDQLRLEGAIFFRTELTEGFESESTPRALADALHPGAERLILFHIVAAATRRRNGSRSTASSSHPRGTPYRRSATAEAALPPTSGDLLATTDLGVAAVARRVGYDSDEAFSRAFKRARGLSPSHWRADRSGPVPPTAP